LLKYKILATRQSKRICHLRIMWKHGAVFHKTLFDFSE
jgi:hypothetical protein